MNEAGVLPTQALRPCTLDSAEHAIYHSPTLKAACNRPKCDFGSGPECELVEDVGYMPFGSAEGN